jgi:hypothetical protein
MLSWVLATTVGVGAGLALGVVVVEQAGGFITGHPVNIVGLTPAVRAFSFFTVGGITGLVLGVAQGLVIGRETVPMTRWINATALGLAVAFAVSSLVVDALLDGIASPIGVLSFVLTAGVVFGSITSRPLTHDI